MATITKSFKGSTGKNIIVNLEIDNAKVTGYAIINGMSYNVSGTAVIQNRKCLKIEAAPAPYMPIADSLYNEIDAVCKVQYAANMTPKEILETSAWLAEQKYNQAMRDSYGNVAIIEARNEWNRLSAELAKLA